MSVGPPGGEARPDPTAHRSPLVERDAELAAVDTVLDRAASGSGGVLVFQAQPGLGKSRLLEAAQRRASCRGWRVLSAGAVETERMFPFGVVLQLFEPAVRAASAAERDRMFGGVAGLTRPLLTGTHTDAEAGSMFPLLHGLHWLVTNLAEAGPVLVTVDDVHWCDEPSLQFLRYLAHRLTAMPVALVLGSRPSDTTLAGFERWPTVRIVRPEPLSADAVLTVAEAWSDAVPDDAFVAACLRVTAGNPLYLHELLLALDDLGARPDAGSVALVDRLEVASVARAVFFRASPLGAPAVDLLRAAAVFGGRGLLRQIAPLAGVEAGDAARYVDALVGLDVLAPGEPVSFSHPLVQAAIYADTPAGRRGELHLQVAQLLAAEFAPPGQVAAHLLTAPAGGRVDTVVRLQEAARLARGRGADQEAVQFLARALAEPPPAELRWAVLTELGEAETATGADAEEHLRAAVQCAAGPVQTARARQLLGRYLQRRRLSEQAAAQFEQALVDAGGADAELTASLQADLVVAGSFDPAMRERVRRSLQVAVEPGPADSLAQRRLLANLALRHAQDAEPADRAAELVARAWGDGRLLAEAGIEGRTWLICIWALLLAERYEPADELAGTVIEQAAARGSMAAFAAACHFRGQIRFRLGRLPDALADLELSVATSQEGWAEYLSAALAARAEVLVEMGRLGPAEDALREAQAASQQEALFDEGSILAARARLDLARSRPGEALTAARQLGRLLDEQLKAPWSIMPWRAICAAAAMRTDAVDEARTLLHREQQLAERIGARPSLGRALRLRALVEPDDAVPLLERAVDVLDGTGAAVELAAALTELGAALRRRGQRTRARDPLRRAVDLAHRSGAAPLAERANAELLATGAARRQPGARGVDALTPSERRVAELAAAGRTSREIAQALFVTTKTVEFHLGNTFQARHPVPT